MSWDAALIDDRGHVEGEWNYTHNTNAMINHAIDAALPRLLEGVRTAWFGDRCWWDLIDGQDGPTGAALLNIIVDTMRADMPTYRAMNPDNGWGNADRLVSILLSMIEAVPEWPTVWHITG